MQFGTGFQVPPLLMSTRSSEAQSKALPIEASYTVTITRNPRIV